MVDIELDTNVRNASGKPVYNETEGIGITVTGNNSYNTTDVLVVKLDGETVIDEQIFPGDFEEEISESKGPGTYKVEAELFDSRHDRVLGNDPKDSDSLTFVVREYNPPEEDDPEEPSQEEPESDDPEPTEPTEPTDPEEPSQEEPPESGRRRKLFIAGAVILGWVLMNR